jgi:hypothetical protein
MRRLHRSSKNRRPRWITVMSLTRYCVRTSSLPMAGAVRRVENSCRCSAPCRSRSRARQRWPAKSTRRKRRLHFPTRGWINGFPSHSGEMATLYGGLDKPGPYLVLMKWYPGYMSAPHTYATDRLSLVLSGTWWVNSGADFDPNNTVPVPAGGFVRRVARAAHYDGVKGGATEAVIALFGIAPVEFELIDQSRQAWRQV